MKSLPRLDAFFEKDKEARLAYVIDGVVYYTVSAGIALYMIPVSSIADPSLVLHPTMKTSLLKPYIESWYNERQLEQALDQI